jgi:hypothetical protein
MDAFETKQVARPKVFDFSAAVAEAAHRDPQRLKQDRQHEKQARAERRTPDGAEHRVVHGYALLEVPTLHELLGGAPLQIDGDVRSVASCGLEVHAPRFAALSRVGESLGEPDLEVPFFLAHRAR